MAAKKILIVDDEPDVVTYLETFFQDNGYETISARTGREAFDKALAEEPDLITLDITMPEESGVRAYRELTSSDKTKHIPIIIITGVTHDFKGFIESRRQVPPPVAYFEKPIDREKLLVKVKELIAGRE